MELKCCPDIAVDPGFVSENLKSLSFDSRLLGQSCANVERSVVNTTIVLDLMHLKKERTQTYIYQKYETGTVYTDYLRDEESVA